MPARTTPAPATPLARPVTPAGATVALLAARRVLDEFLADPANAAHIDRAAELLSERFRAGSKVLIVGNGGSACDAAHFAEELTGRFRAPRPGEPDRPPLPALACTDAAHITCTANDYGFEHVFSRWVTALAKPGDVLIALSTSGNSPNVVRAVDAAKAAGARTIALLGKTGGSLKGACDLEWIVGRPDDPADRVQEVHMLVLHALIEGVERVMFGRA
jgi:D-sedoheptulose 7-phosphate isomerase